MSTEYLFKQCQTNVKDYFPPIFACKEKVVSQFAKSVQNILKKNLRNNLFMLFNLCIINMDRSNSL